MSEVDDPVGSIEREDELVEVDGEAVGDAIRKLHVEPVCSPVPLALDPRELRALEGDAQPVSPPVVLELRRRVFLHDPWGRPPEGAHPVGPLGRSHPGIVVGVAPELAAVGAAEAVGGAELRVSMPVRVAAVAARVLKL